MAEQTSKRLLIPTTLGVLAIAAFAGYFVIPTRSSATTEPFENSIKVIDGYRSWFKANAEPQVMPDQTSALCAVAVPAKADAAANPHRHKFLTVYVNDIGRTALLEQKTPAFPEGSVIVKEKLSEKSSETPELLTVMIKQAKGFNPNNGDWEFMVVDGAGTKVLSQGKLDNCQSCHNAKPETDFVFRTYLPGEVLSKLK
jgi:Cytochrome P460